MTGALPVADPRGEGVRARRRSPLDWGQKKFIARPKKHTHLQNPFCMPECAKTRLQQSRISKFSGGGPPDPLFKGRGRKSGEEREGKGKGRREGKDREGTGGTGRDRGGKEGRNGVVGRGGALHTGSP